MINKSIKMPWGGGGGPAVAQHICDTLLHTLESFMCVREKVWGKIARRFWYRSWYAQQLNLFLEFVDLRLPYANNFNGHPPTILPKYCNRLPGPTNLLRH